MVGFWQCVLLQAFIFMWNGMVDAFVRWCCLLIFITVIPVIYILYFSKVYFFLSARIVYNLICTYLSVNYTCLVITKFIFFFEHLIRNVIFIIFEMFIKFTHSCNPIRPNFMYALLMCQNRVFDTTHNKYSEFHRTFFVFGNTIALKIPHTHSVSAIDISVYGKQEYFSHAVREYGSRLTFSNGNWITLIYTVYRFSTHFTTHSFPPKLRIRHVYH